MAPCNVIIVRVISILRRYALCHLDALNVVEITTSKTAACHLKRIAFIVIDVVITPPPSYHGCAQFPKNHHITQNSSHSAIGAMNNNSRHSQQRKLLFNYYCHMTQVALLTLNLSYELQPLYILVCYTFK